MDFRILIILIFFVVNLNGQNQISKTLLEGEKLMTNFIVLKVDTEYYENGNIKDLFYFDMQHNNRKVVSYYNTGELKSILNRNENEKLDGLIIGFFKSSKLESYSFFVNGIGITFDFYEDGRLKQQYQSDTIGFMGYYSSYCSEGELYSEVFYDSLDYVQKGYHCNGKMRFQGRILNNNTKEGKWEYWNKEGELIKKEYWEKGELIKEEEFDVPK